MSSSTSVLWRSVPLAAAAAIGFAVGRFALASREGARPTGDAATANGVAASPPDAAQPTVASMSRDGHGAITAEDRWRQWANATRSEHVERELCAAIEEMAKTAPDRAMGLAAKEPSLRSRELLRQAALRGWAATAPDAALAAAMKLPGMDNRAAIAAVLQGAAADPGTVIRLGRQITDGADPVALDYGKLTIGALAERGDFEEALRFAAEGPTANRAQWLNDAFAAWARAEPQQALAQFQRMADPALRHDALLGLISGWADADPASLAEHALQEPSAEDRTMELGQTLTNWVLRDPAAASQWLSQRDPDPNLDAGLSSVATLPALMSQRPEVATEWAEAISDPQQRQAALRTIGDEWRRRAPAALQQFLQANPRLDEADRAALAGTPEAATPAG